MSKLMSITGLGLAGLVTTSLVAMQAGAASAQEFTKRSDDAVELVLVADDDDDDTNDDTDGAAADTRSRTTGPSRSTNDRTRSNRTAVSRDRDLSRGDKTKDWTRDGKGPRTRDHSRNKTNDGTRNDTRR